MKTFAFVVALVAGAASLGAQTPAAPAPVAPAPAAPAVDLPSPPADYSYSTGGRRDPFMSLTKMGNPLPSEGGSGKNGAASLDKLLVDELSVKGIVQSNGTYVAMVSGPGARQTFTAKVGSRLLDGTVQSISADAVVILQKVSDPLSLQKQRQVRKPLRTQEEGK